MDALCRFPPVMLITDGIIERIKEAQKTDNECKLIIELLKQNPYNDYVMRRDILYRFANGTLVVPKAMQNQIIRAVEEVVKQEYSIDKLTEKVLRVIQNCVPCILGSQKAGKQEGMYNPIEKLDIPLHTYHIDHLGPLPSTAKSYQYLFVVVDSFTKYVWIHPVKNVTASETLKRFEIQKEVFGNPYRIISDRGAAFTSTEFAKYCKAKNVLHLVTTTGVPRGNGQVERMNGTIIPILTKLSIEEPLKWYKHVAKIQRCINSTISRSTGKTSFELLVGVKMRNAEDAALAQIMEKEMVADFEEQRRDLRQAAKINIGRIQEENRKNYNQNRKEPRKYNVRDLVAIKKTQFGTGKKVHPSFLGPYRVTKAKKNDRFEVERLGDGAGPKNTATSPDFMKLWMTFDEETEESSGAED